MNQTNSIVFTSRRTGFQSFLIDVIWCGFREGQYLVCIEHEAIRGHIFWEQERLLSIWPCNVLHSDHRFPRQRSDPFRPYTA